MKNLTKFFGIITLTVIIGFSMTACDDGSGGGGGGLVNEVMGKTVYLSGSEKIVFNTGTTFQAYSRSDLEAEGSYSCKNKTITVTVKYVYLDGKKLTKNQALKAILKQIDDMFTPIYADFDAYLRMEMLETLLGNTTLEEAWDNYQNTGGEKDFEEWLDELNAILDKGVDEWKAETGITDADSFINMILEGMGFADLDEFKETMQAEFQAGADALFTPKTYDYQFTTDEYLLVQEKLPANKGSNNLQGETFTDRDDPIEYVFESKTYKVISISSDDDDPEDVLAEGSYAYDSGAPGEVWFKPELLGDKTMLEYYNASTSSDAEENAAETNSAFRLVEGYYSLDPNLIDRNYGGNSGGNVAPVPPPSGGKVVVMPSMSETKNLLLKMFNQK